MFTEIIDIMFKTKEEMIDEPSEGEGYIALIYLAWFSIMLYFVLGVI